MKVFKVLAGQPGFNDSSARFTTSLRTKFGFGILGITGGVLVVSILVSGLILQSSTRATVTNYARNELANIADSVAFVSEMNTTPEDMDAFLGTLKLGSGGAFSPSTWNPGWPSPRVQDPAHRRRGHPGGPAPAGRFRAACR